MITLRNFYINGAWTAPAKVRDYPVIDPATEEQVAVISLGDQAIRMLLLLRLRRHFLRGLPCLWPSVSVTLRT